MEKFVKQHCAPDTRPSIFSVAFRKYVIDWRVVFEKRLNIIINISHSQFCSSLPAGLDLED
jgi:hypothetical protein